MLDLITVAQMFIYNAFIVCGCVFLCVDKQSSVCFADVRRIATRASVIKTEFASGPGRRDTCHLSDLDETWPD